MARRYSRDRRGRFASVGATARGGRLTTMSGKRNATVTAKGPSVATAGRVKPGRSVKPAATTSSPRAANAIRRLDRPSKPAYDRASQAGNSIRRIDRTAKPAQDLRTSIESKMRGIEGLGRKIDRSAARDITSGKQLDLAMLKISGQTGRARAVIERRMRRAFNVQNGRNPGVGSKALYVYKEQLDRVSDFSNKRVSFRRTPMTPAQVKRGEAKRNKRDMAMLDKALKADVRASMKSKPAKPKPKPRRKKS
jgi:hypothetical protein